MVVDVYNAEDTVVNPDGMECVLFCCRYHHAAVCLSAMQSLLIYGGIVEHSVVSDELWIFSLHTSNWRRLAVRMLCVATVNFIHVTVAACDL